MNYDVIIRYLFRSTPDLEGGVDWWVDPDRTLRWETDKYPRPTDEEMRSAWLDAEKWQKKLDLRKPASDEYQSVLFPEGPYTEIEKDEIIEKKAAARAGVNPGFRIAEKNASDKIDALRQKRVEKWQAVNGVEQQAGETLEQAVERVRAIVW